MAVVWKKLAYESEVMLNTVAEPNAMLYSVSDDTPAALSMAASRIPARLAAGDIVAATVAEILTLLSVTSGANVTGDNPPQAHKDTHDPGGTDPLDAGNPTAILEVVAVNEGSAESWARSDHVHAIVHDITENSLVTVDGTPASAEIALWTSDGLDGATPAAVAATMALDDIGVPDAAVDFNLQEATDLVVFTVADIAARDALNAAATEVGQLCWATSEGTLSICTESSA